MADLQNFFRGATETGQIGTTTMRQDKIQNNANPAQSTASFPRAGLVSRTPKGDQRLKNKMNLIDSDSGMTPFGQVNITDEDMDVLEDKRQLAEEANFDSWLGQNFHKGDVAARRWLQETVPDYYAVREKEIDDRADFAKMVAKVKLRGPQTTEEMVLVYGLMEGKISLQDGWNVIGYTEKDGDVKGDGEAQQNRFAARLLGPYKYQSQKERTENSTKEWNPFRQKNPPQNVGGSMWGGSNRSRGGNAGSDFARMQQMFDTFSQ